MIAQMLVQQQTYRTPNLNIHQTTSTQNETLLPKAHPVNDGLCLHRHNPTNLLHFFQRFSSKSQKSLYRSTSNGFLNKNSTFFPFSNTIFLLNEPEEEEEKQVNNFNCDKIEPVIAENTNTEEVNKISAATIIDELGDETILNTTSSLNVECQFCKPKQHSSLTRISSSSSSNDERGSIITDSIEKTDDNNNDNNQEEKSQEIGENLQPIAIESLSSNENNEKKDDSLVENEESNNENPPFNRFRGRKLRNRLYHHTSSTSEKPTSDNILQFVVPTETPIAPSSSPSSSSPILSTTNVLSPGVSPNILTGVLKRKDSTRTTKKTVCFADSVGLELTQVQYIQSSTDNDDSKESLFVKNNLYTPKTSIYEYKPWSFDIELTSKQISNVRTPKRFFCSYHQPISEHPDIYLHEIRKSHIKLEHADICLKSSSTGEQYLYGTLWVTNDNYRKNVTVKYTFNQWLNTYEYKAQNCYHSNDFRNIDQFEFSIDIPDDVDRIDFILRYCVNGQEHWDNNEGNDYTLETESVYTPQTTVSLPHDCDFNEVRFY